MSLSTTTNTTMNSDEKTITQVLSENTNVLSLWYDWFCKSHLLYGKGVRLLEKLREIADSKKFDNDSTYVFFKNNCPLSGSLYDDFRICDIKTGEVLYTIIPSSGYKSSKGKAVVFGIDNNFEEPIIMGTWNKIKKWFLS